MKNAAPAAEGLSIRETSDGACFAVKVHPRAKKDAVSGVLGEKLKVTIRAAPEDGAANAACLELLAGVLKVPRASISIAAGQGSRNKIIRVAGLTASDVRVRLMSCGI